MTVITNLNRELWKALGLKVYDGAALARDGQTWLKLFVRAADGFADSPPDFEHSLGATCQHTPITVQIVRRWSYVDDMWIFAFQDLATGQFLSEGRDPKQAAAASKALLGYLQLEAVRG